MLFFFIFQNTKKHLYIYTYTHVNKKKKKKKNNSFVAVFRRLVATLMSRVNRMMSFFSLWSGVRFSNERSKPRTEGVAGARTHTRRSRALFRAFWRDLFFILINYTSCQRKRSRREI